jgi:hypothetical protein
VVQPGGASTPLVGGPGEPLSRTYSGFFSRVDYRQRLELNVRDSDEDVLFQQEMRYPERGASSLASWCRGEQEFSACAAAGGVGVSEGIQVGL